jgi:hypothetical protein
MGTLRNIIRWENARILFASVFLCGFALEAVYCLTSPAVPLLPPRRDGSWIRPNHPANLVAYDDSESSVLYRKRLVAPEKAGDVAVELTAYRDAAVFLDGRPIPFPAPSSWKDRVRILIPSHLLTPGPHELLLRVRNRMGPPLFHLSSDIAGLGEPEGWEFSPEGTVWKPAARCDDMMTVELRAMFPTVPEALRGSLRILLPLFAGILAAVCWKPRPLVRFAAPGSLRFFLMALWAILGINNIFKLSLDVGFDYEFHVEYFDYILQNHRLPIASEGVQMFQPPLYYLLAAALYRAFNAFFPPETSLLLLRIIPLACGLLLVELSARILRELFPEREDLQSCGLVVGGLLPMNLSACHYFGNEPLAALLTALLLYRVIVTFRKREPIHWRDAVFLGAVGGLGTLAKVTPALLIPVICLFFLFVPREDSFGPGIRAKLAGLFLLAAVAVSGWFYLRNWFIFGKPFIGGWDPLTNTRWWQDPGYRTVGDFLTFGEVLRQPILAVFNGFADGVYSTFWSDGYLGGKAFFSFRPAWNYTLLAAGIALSVVPASSMGFGAAIAFWRTARRDSWPQTFLLAAAFVYLAALLHLYISLPIYSTAKATYLMGLTPVFSVLAATGAGLFVGRKYVGPLFVSLLGTWGATTYLAFFIR